MKDPLSEHLIRNMEVAVTSIKEIAESNGYERDFDNPRMIVDYLSDTALDHDDYGLLFAESRSLADAFELLEEFGTKEAKAKGYELIAFNYNA